MHNNSIFSCSIGTTNTDIPLGIEIWFDDQQIYNVDHVDRTIDFRHEFSDVDGEHCLRFVMKNKIQDHTLLDDDGNIVQDACITIDHAAFDKVELGHMFIEQTQYTHDFNGTQPEVTTQFYGKMGCNGTVSLEFTSPIYIWLLEHM